MLSIAALTPLAALLGGAGLAREVDAAAAMRGARCRAPVCAATLDFSISQPGSLTKDERMRSRYGGFIYEPEGGWEEADKEPALFSYDELAVSMREIASFTRGDTTTGEVIGFEPNGALIDIGVKSSAYCTVWRAPAAVAAPLRRAAPRFLCVAARNGAASGCAPTHTDAPTRALTRRPRRRKRWRW